MPTLTRETPNSTLPPAPSGQRKAEFERAMREAAVAVHDALHRYCDCYIYTGSVIVGERLAEMEIPDHICAAAEIVCEVADEEGVDPRLCPTESSVHPEYLAAVLGWLKFAGNDLPSTWLDRFAWNENENWFIHPEHAPVVARAGLKVERPKSCYCFKRPAWKLPIDPPPNALLFKTRDSVCPVVCVVNGMAHADPVNVLPDHLRAEIPLCGEEWTKLTIAGIPVEVRATGGDGLFMGVAVDTGQMMRFNWEQGRSAFDVALEESVSTCA
ncbi:MAG: hypothetical protein ABS95_02285 [Verrucomicrobia bacterium SCN 57-15]|nr:MAG: hypothetical protein ABS95_02285 [Verrucomicrobia bacterium SCN 57-15]